MVAKANKPFIIQGAVFIAEVQGLLLLVFRREGSGYFKLHGKKKLSCIIGLILIKFTLPGLIYTT